MSSRLVVIDTNLLICTAAHPEKRFAIWTAVQKNDISIVITRWALDELQQVAARPKLKAMLPRLEESFPSFLSELLKQADIRPEPPERFILKSDPNDSLFFNLAIEVNAFALVSLDRKHVLCVGEANHPQHDELKVLAPGLRILHPREFAAELIREKVLEQSMSQQAEREEDEQPGAR